MPSIEKVRFVSSGTEAAMSAVRVARGVTGRSKIIKMSGHYHGHVDALLVQAGSAATTLGHAQQPRRDRREPSQDTILCPFNDADGRGRRLRSISRPGRRGLARADRRQHGARAARAGLSRIGSAS